MAQTTMQDQQQTQATLHHHLAAFNEGLDALMSDYTDASVLITPERTYRGTAEIRRFFEGFVAGMPEGLMEALELECETCTDEVAYIRWHALPWIPMATDTFVIRDGKIATQTFAAYSPIDA